MTHDVLLSELMCLPRLTFCHGNIEYIFDKHTSPQYAHRYAHIHGYEECIILQLTLNIAAKKVACFRPTVGITW